MTTHPQPPATVTQADREAAEPFRRGHGGKYDRDVASMAHAFAAHRQSGIAEGLRMAKAVCRTRADEIEALCRDGSGPTEARVSAIMTLEMTIDAIEKLAKDAT